MIYTEGQTVWPQVTFRDLDGVLANPATVVLTVEDPLGTISTPALSNVSTGVYRAEVELDVEGWWTYRWEGTNAFGSAVCEGTICAKATALIGT